MKVDIFNSSNTNFKAKYSANNLRFKNDDFFVRIKGYGKNIDWAYEVKKQQKMLQKKCKPIIIFILF